MPLFKIENRYGDIILLNLATVKNLENQFRSMSMVSLIRILKRDKLESDIIILADPVRSILGVDIVRGHWEKRLDNGLVLLRECGFQLGNLRYKCATLVHKSTSIKMVKTEPSS